jgi:hypothetical protein
MTKSLETDLYRAAALTFEGLAFAFASAVVSEEEAEAKPEAAVQVSFGGSLAGRLVLGVSGEVLRHLTTNMLGDERAVTERLQADALGELANVICGNALERIGGKAARFRLEAPRPADLRELTPPPGLASTSVRVGLEGGRADLLLVLERSPTAIAGAAQS